MDIARKTRRKEPARGRILIKLVVPLDLCPAEPLNL